MDKTMAAAYVAGFPRIGEQRELKKVLEQYWDKQVDFAAVATVAKTLRQRHWQYQQAAGIRFISSNDFSLYDSMLDMSIMLNAVPERFQHIDNPQERYFAMARGSQNVLAMEMTKWFNTNYHYLVPELAENMNFSLNAAKIMEEYQEAKQLGIATKINVIGPVTFLSLAKRTDGHADPLALLPKILPCYIELLQQVAKLDETVYVQFDEPIVVRNPDSRLLETVASVYKTLTGVCDQVKIILLTYFDHAVEAVEALREVPLYGIGLDFVHGPENVDVLTALQGKKLIAGVVDGRNIWKTDYRQAVALLEKLAEKVNRDDIVVATSCSLLHVPYSLDYETNLPADVKSWLSFAKEKLTELADIAAIYASKNAGGEAWQKNQAAMADRAGSVKTHNQAVRKRMQESMKPEREGSFAERNAVQKAALQLPPLPTTTIGSFPQTAELRKLRRDYKNKVMSRETYEQKIHEYIDECVAFQEDIGLDVLVHGEPERNDMVEYFGEQLDGFVFTQNGWVQSYGSRCVKPPVIYGDVSRPQPMTVDTIVYAQSRTSRIMKGMLTGPVTILNWSFVRNDLERSQVCKQLALVICDEIRDLQTAGIKMIQVDEAAFKEGYPLRRNKAEAYEHWAVDCFKLSVSSAAMSTQIHTHMCYSDFTTIMHVLESMDADVITLETAKSGSKLLKVFAEHGYRNEIGPGTYDIHSPRVPAGDEFEHNIKELMAVIPVERLWVNPDCGLKTRKWEEVKPSLAHMVEATKRVRLTVKSSG